MTKKFLKFIALALVVMLSATCMVACDKSEDDNTITIWAFDSSAEAAKKAVEIYNNAHPESTYQFDVVSLGQDDMVEKIKIALATNSKETLPDMFYDEDYNFAEYITYYGDLFYDLTSKVDIDNYYSYKSLNVTLDDKVYAVPYDSGTGVLFYRSDLIQKAGYNDSDMQNLTWSEFITIGQKVKETTGVDMIIMCPEGDMEGRLLYQSAGTWFFDENGNGKVTDAWFMELSHKYEVERDELKKKILELNRQLAKISEVREGKEHFLSCVRSFAEMNQVTPMILQELIEKIEVYAVEGTGLNRTQSVIIHYKFIGELDMPENFDKIKVNTRKGVEVEYLRTTKTA